MLLRTIMDRELFIVYLRYNDHYNIIKEYLKEKSYNDDVVKNVTFAILNSPYYNTILTAVTNYYRVKFNVNLLSYKERVILIY